MKRIMLVCSAGMSTSMLVNKMKKEVDAKGETIEIFAVSISEASREINNVDIVLLGPQVRYQKDDIVKMADNHIPVEVIDMRDYGTMNGKKVLENALDKINI